MVSWTGGVVVVLMVVVMAAAVVVGFSSGGGGRGGRNGAYDRNGEGKVTDVVALALSFAVLVSLAVKLDTSTEYKGAQGERRREKRERGTSSGERGARSEERGSGSGDQGETEVGLRRRNSQS